MRRAVGAALLLTCLGLTACGHSSDAAPPKPETAGSSETAGKPTWGCEGRSLMVSDYISGARGTSSRDAALARYREDGDKVTFSPRGQHTNARWLLIDDANHIHAAVGLIHGRNGWLVSTVEQCSSE